MKTEKEKDAINDRICELEDDIYPIQRQINKLIKELRE